MKLNLFSKLLLLSPLALLLGSTGSQAAPQGLGVSPEVVTFTASPQVVRPGDTVTVAWNTRGTTSVTLEWGQEANHNRAAMQQRTGLPSSGKLTFQVTEDTIYDLRCATVTGTMCLPVSATVRMK
jgi:plastocyanin